MQHIHLGLIMVRILALHRRDASITALIVLRDTRWRSHVSIISTIEIDLSSGTQLVYIAPDVMLSIHDFMNHIELVILTHGYELWQGGESNLLLTRALVARLTNSSYAGFRYNITGVANYLALLGISAIPGQCHTIADLQGRTWHLRSSKLTTVQIPRSLITHQRLDGSLRLSFSSYTPSQPLTEPSHPDSLDSLDNELTQHAYMAYTSDEPIWDTSEDLIEPEDEDTDNPFSLFLYLTTTSITVQALPEGGGDLPYPSLEQEANPKPELESSEAPDLPQTCYTFEDQLTELDYPKLRKLADKANSLYTSVSSSYLPPNEPIMGPVMYPPASSDQQQAPFQSTNQFQNYCTKFSNFKKSYQQNMWTLPSAHNNQGSS
ncbi:hypothetical protein MA16_Dca016273 [Dendrobium catenatum]|uniref:Uncharacterized protein n=1 Tax=Dendrobium catenatum TaxID=906689 RepID=A0A2I0WVY8_9ASPA|nr:hypothetical protein MA16_Dca016273 [Dendrobium catenatum]